MIIQCEACKTKFRVGDGKVKPPGIKVRCSKCGEVFFFEYSLHEDPKIETEPVPANQDKPELADTPPIADESGAPNDSLANKEEPVNEVANFEAPKSQGEPFSAPKAEDISSTENAEPENAEPEVDQFEAKAESEDTLAPSDNTENEVDPFLNLEIDHLDDMAEKPDLLKEDVSQETFKTLGNEVQTEQQEKPVNEFQSANLSLDQDVLEQTYTKGSVVTSPEIKQPAYNAPAGSPTVRRYRRNNSGGGFLKKFFGWIFALILIGALIIVSMFLLNETKIYPNDYFDKINSLVKSYYPGSDALELKKSIRIKSVNGKWESSKYGQVYVVSGEAENLSAGPVNYLKLRVYYVSDGTNIFIQELFAGNSLSRKEIKNSSFNSIQAKLNRKNGDISYDDANNLDGLNFDIQPGEVIPFYSVFPAKEKILGLKYRVEVVAYDSAKISEDP